MPNEIIIYERQTLRSWKEEAQQLEVKKAEKKALAAKRQNDRKKAKAEMERISKVSMWRLELRKDRQNAKRVEARKQAAALALAKLKEEERLQREAEERARFKQARDEAQLVQALEGHAVTRCALMLKARHECDDELHESCAFCYGNGFIEPDKTRCKFCDGRGLYFGYQQALHDIFEAGGREWKSNTNWFKKPGVSSWYGVNYVDGRDNVYERETVAKIRLSNNNLVGSLPSSISLLTRLVVMDLSKNHLTGSIPTGITELAALETCLLFDNQLTGRLPDSLGQLESLKILRVDNNMLGGSIPDSIGNCAALKHLSLHSNQISAAVPESIGQLRKLTVLMLHNNRLTGTIPHSVGSMKSLVHFAAHSNMLTGQIPETIGDCTALQKLTLYSNYLQGSIPSSVRNLSQLVVLDVSDNNLDGSVPDGLIDSLENIKSLALGGNCKRLEDSLDTLHQSLSAPTGDSLTGASLRINQGALMISKASKQWMDDKGPYTFKDEPQRALLEWKRYSKFRKAALERQRVEQEEGGF